MRMHIARLGWPTFGALLLTLCGVQPALAVPAYSRQTNTECAACHTGGFGPNLTPHGIRFKLGGYVDSDGKGGHIPLSLIAQYSSNRTEPGNPGTRGQTDSRLTNFDLYLAGKLFGEVGAFVKLARTDSPTRTTTALNEVDIRFAREAQLGGRDVQWGLSLNNNPGVQDPVNGMPAWGFGAFGPGRDFVQGTRTGTLLNKAQGGLAYRVVGLSGFAVLDKSWYGELGSYRSLSRADQDSIGLPVRTPGAVVGDPGRLSNTVYWRGLWMKDAKTQFVSLGVFGLNTDLQEDRIGPRNRVNDVGIDATYMYLGDREHVLHLRGSHIVERRSYGATVRNPFFPVASQSSGKITETALGGTYYYKDKIGLLGLRTRVRTNADPALFLPNGKADTTTNVVALFWNVWGREGDWAPIGTNLQLGIARFGFSRFNGSATNIFGGPVPVNASDLKQTQIYARAAF